MKQKHMAALAVAPVTILVLISCVVFYPSGGALKFEPDTLPASKLGEAYETEIRVLENITPVGDFSISEGALPPGLELIKVEDEEDTARIRGVPEEAGTFTFTIHVWCYGTNVQGQEGEKEFSIFVGQ